ncbi:unnamed protein product [Rotaria sp. Silwood1]|nr:unnamed protein product [Rotaria sp. Silwood1]
MASTVHLRAGHHGQLRGRAVAVVRADAFQRAGRAAGPRAVDPGRRLRPAGWRGGGPGGPQAAAHRLGDADGAVPGRPVDERAAGHAQRARDLRAGGRAAGRQRLPPAGVGGADAEARQARGVRGGGGAVVRARHGRHGGGAGVGRAAAGERRHRVDVGHPVLPGRTGIPLPSVPDDTAAAPVLRRGGHPPAAVLGAGAVGWAGAVKHRLQPLTLAGAVDLRAAGRNSGARRPQGRGGPELPRPHALRRAGLVHPRSAGVDTDLRLHREAVRAAPRPAGVPPRVADRLPPLHRQPPGRGLRAAGHQPAGAPAVRLGGQGRHPRLGAGPALPHRAVPHRPRGRPRAVLDAPRVPRGADAVAPARGAPQREEHGLAGRLAAAHPGAHHHAHAGAGADLRAGLQQGGHRRLHRRCRLPGRVQPRQRQRAAGPAALHHRHAQLPPLAPLAGPRGAGQELRGALCVPGPPVRHRRAVGAQVAGALRRAGRLRAGRLPEAAALPAGPDRAPDPPHARPACRQRDDVRLLRIALADPAAVRFPEAPPGHRHPRVGRRWSGRPGRRRARPGTALHRWRHAHGAGRADVRRDRVARRQPLVRRGRAQRSTAGAAPPGRPGRPCADRGRRRPAQRRVPVMAALADPPAGV